MYSYTKISLKIMINILTQAKIHFEIQLLKLQNSEYPIYRKTEESIEHSKKLSVFLSIESVIKLQRERKRR